MATAGPLPSKGVTLENVAEEVLNGFFCHYEPPTSETAQKKAAEEATKFPYKYGFQGRKKSILRPSRLVRQQKPQTVRSVTWRDEQKKPDVIESKITSCAMDQCNLFGNSTGDGIADTLTPTPVTAPIKPSAKPVLKKKAAKGTKAAPFKPEGTPKKVLYDDEGNPIDEGSSPQDENVPPSSGQSRSGGPSSQSHPYYCTPFGRPGDETPLGEVQLDSNPTMNDDPGVYEPESYDRPPSANATAYRRIRSPPIRNATPRYSREEEEDDLEKEHEFLERVGRVPPRARSNSPSRRRPDDRYYEGTENGSDSPRRSPRGLGWMKRLRRPATPHRRRKSKDGDYDSEDDMDRLGGPSRSSSRERGRSRDSRDYPEYEDDATGDYEYRRSGRDENGYPIEILRRPSRSPSRRADIYSDITEDVGTDRYDTPPRTRSRSPSRRDYYPMDDKDFVDGLAPQPTRDYGDRRDYDERDLDVGYDGDLRRRRSRDDGRGPPSPRDYRDDYDRRASYDDLERRYHDDGYYRRSSQEFDEYDRRRSEGTSRRDSSMSPRSRRKWGFGFSKSKKSQQDDGDGRASPTPIRELTPEEEEYEYQRRYDEKLRRSRRESDPIPSRRPRRDIYTDDPEQDLYEQRRPHTTTSAQFRRGPLPLDTSRDEEADGLQDRRNRDPTPRMSMEGREATPGLSQSREELPPTPRMPKVATREGRVEMETLQRTARPSRTVREERVEMETLQQRPPRPSRDREEETLQRPVRPNIDTKDETVDEKHARTRRALMKQLSPTSMATDDEIREEVSSVGMESHTIRPLNYPNPFLQVPPPILEDTATNAEDSAQEPSTLSSGQKSKDSTLSSNHPTKGRVENPHVNAVQAASSGSSKSKKYWRGWRKTIGKVKNIVQEIDEKRIPPPFMPGVDSKMGKRPRKTE